MELLKKHGKLLGYLVSAIFLYLTFKDTDFRLIFDQFRYINPLHIAIAAIFNLGFFLIRGFYQINNLRYINGNIRYADSVTSIGIAQFYNIIFPARLGEVIRVYFLGKKSGINRAALLSYIFIEKVMDFLIILILFVPFVIMGFGTEQIARNVYIMIGFLVLVFVSIFFYVRFNNFFFPIILKIIPDKVSEPVTNLNAGFVEGLRFYKSISQLGVGLALLLLSWVMIAAEFWFISISYVELLNLPVYSALFFMIFASLSVLIPGAPSGLGVMHYALFLVIGILSAEAIAEQKNLVAAFVIILHFFIHMVELVVGGGIILIHRFFYGEKIYDKTLSSANHEPVS